MNRIMKSDFYKYCAEKKSYLLLSIGIALLLYFISAVNYRSSMEGIIMSDGKLVGVKEENLINGISLEISAKKGDTTVNREVMLKRSLNNPEEINIYEMNPDEEIDIEITKLIRSINQSEDKNTVLPQSVGDDISLSWGMGQNKMNVFLPFLMPPMIMIFFYRGRKDELYRKNKEETDEIVSELPSFNNKLVLLLGSGLVYEEALKRVSLYDDGEMNKEKKLLGKVVGTLVKDAERTNGDPTKLLNEFAKRKKINELKRITLIIMDNQKKGTDLRSKLVLEGELLWDKRKKKAEEMGRISETKLTIPLGIMMVGLLIITAGPAIMQM